ncbi:hypothetical protein S40285_09761, partial [Stachybotrys chlorohalonatus IBT 40285]
MKAEFQLEFAK